MSDEGKLNKLAGISFSEYPSVNSASETETLVCLHGIGGDDKSFLPQSISLSDEFRVISWNMPGYQNSDAITPVTFELLAKTLKEWLETLNAGPVHLVGQSIGGMIAQECVHRYPELVKSLVLIATTTAFGGRDDSFKDAFLKARLKPLDEGKSMQTLAEETVPLITGSKVSDESIDQAVRSMAAVPVETYREILKCLVTFNRRESLANIKQPVCVISGSEDSNAPAVTMKKMAEKLSHSEYHELEGAGHLVNLELPEACNDIIRHFIKKQISHD